MDISDIHNPILSCTTPDQLPSNIISLPLAFVRSGFVDVGYGYVGSAGYVTTLRSRTSVSATDACILYSNPTIVGPSDGAVRYNGRPLRCLCMLKGIWKYRISMSRVVVV